MKIIGITGGIGSGKSLVSKVFSALQIPVYDADSHAKRLMTEDALLVQNIKHTFGNDSYLANQSLNRAYLASLVFGNDDMLRKLNACVHPAVYRDFERWTQLQDSPYVIKEAALMFESNSYLQCDEIILVTASEDARIHRVMKRDGLDEWQVRQRMTKQMPEDEKRRKAQYLIENEAEKAILPEIYRLHQYFLQ